MSGLEALLTACVVFLLLAVARPLRPPDRADHAPPAAHPPHRTETLSRETAALGTVLDTRLRNVESNPVFPGGEKQ
jgi:hypothetical protein